MKRRSLEALPPLAGPAAGAGGAGGRAGAGADDPLKGKAGDLDHLALDAKRDRLLLANKANNTLDVVDLKEGKLIEQKPNQTAIQGVAYVRRPGPHLRRARHNGLCNVFDGDNYTAPEDDQVQGRRRQRPLQPRRRRSSTWPTRRRRWA